MMTPLFFFNSILLGVGLAMDAFSVSLANGLSEPGMPLGRRRLIAGTFAGFQFLMPLLGWVCVHTLAERFTAFQRFIPWIALGLLTFIGLSMIRDGLRGGEEEVGSAALAMQGLATSIDALSVGFTIAHYDAPAAVTCSLIIAAVTYLLCRLALRLGRAVGTRLAGKASILGGLILLAIGLEIFLSSLL